VFLDWERDSWRGEHVFLSCSAEAQVLMAPFRLLAFKFGVCL
jgi:hypothetical protein